MSSTCMPAQAADGADCAVTCAASRLTVTGIAIAKGLNNSQVPNCVTTPIEQYSWKNYQNILVVVVVVVIAVVDCFFFPALPNAMCMACGRMESLCNGLRVQIL